MATKASLTSATDTNGNSIYRVNWGDDTKITLATAGTYVDRNIQVENTGQTYTVATVAQVTAMVALLN